MRNVALFAAVAVALLLGAGGAAADGPPAFRLVFDGRHDAQLTHTGTFATSASWCPSGTAVDVSVDAGTDTATRSFTCAGGAAFTATIKPLPAEHGGSGSWQIISGTGALADLRGKGTFLSTPLSGTPGDPATITFRSTWDGVADLDVAPPTIVITGTSARRLPKPKSTYTLRAALSLTDAGGGPVSYVLQVVDPRKPTVALVFKLGLATGTVSTTSRLTVRATTRTVQLRIDATDAVGNQASLAKTVRLR